MSIRLIIYSRRSIYDDLIVSVDGVNNHDKTVEISPTNISVVPMNTRGFSGYAASAYVTLLKYSDFYRQSALKLLQQLVCSMKIQHQRILENSCQTFVVVMKLKMPSKQFLDYSWGEKVTMMALERKEIDYAMSWLSTLGGAFSAMGDHFHRCAHIAGKISMHQFNLAVRLGDPRLLARCQLYACLSFIQQGKFKRPRQVIPKIYKYAIAIEDVQLKRMCQGIWAKLKYTYYTSRKRPRIDAKT